MRATRHSLATLALVVALSPLATRAQDAAAAGTLTITPSADEAPEPTASSAAEESARMHFKLGVELYREGNFRAALIEFQRAYTDAPHYKLLYNLGQASIELQEYVRAIDHLTQYLSAGGQEVAEGRRTEVEATIRSLEARIAHVTISSDRTGAEIFVDDSSVGRVPLQSPVRVAAGRHKITAVVDGLPAMERVLDVAAQEHRSLYLDFEEAPASSAAPAPSVVTRDAPRESEGPSLAVPVAIATTAVLAAGAITMTIVTGLAQRRYDREIDSVSSKDRLDALSDDAQTKAIVTDITWGATLAAGVVTAVLILSDSTDEREPADAHAIGVAIDSRQVSIVGRF